MTKAGIFYGSSSGKTEFVAWRIHKRLGEAKSELLDIADSSPQDFLKYELLILGIPTWGIGELQDDWMDFLSQLEDLDLSGRKVALFGLGDQESYPDTFADATGKVYDSLLHTGCEITGYCSAKGYDFIDSAALREGRFVGLILDEENQAELTDSRIEEWLKSLPSI
ncbi:flavodoxin [Bacteroidota bacterium]